MKTKITLKNYFAQLSLFAPGELTPELRRNYDFTKSVTENHTRWDYYLADATIRESVDKYFADLADFLNSSDTRIAKNARTRTTPVRNAGIRVSRKNAKHVEKLSEEVKFIQRFVRLHNRVVHRNFVLTFVKSLQRAIIQKVIRKTSKIAQDIRDIQDALVRAYNESKGKTVRIAISDKRLTRLVSLAGGEAVFKSLTIMKRFLSMAGKKAEQKATSELLKTAKNFLTNKANSSDPYFGNVKLIFNRISKQKPGLTIEVQQEELNGLKGIVKQQTVGDLGTIYKGRGPKRRKCIAGTFSDSKNRGACSHNKGLSGLVSAEEMVNTDFDELEFSSPWRELIGRPEKNFSIMFHGEPHAGKSILLLKFAEYLAMNFGNVLYVTSEEYGSTTLKKKIAVLMPNVPSRLYFEQSVDAVDLSSFDYVFLDSINHLGLKLQDFRELCLKYPKIGFVIVLQHTKSGDYRGGKDWEHHVQIGAEVAHGVATVFRNRYGVFGRLNFFEYFGTTPEMFTN